ncbi:hypothetical protein [Paenibacillus ehimensis]|uniref:hypothetical protein n=1 Tax=Paenibacillus ehimensis TaxID=79264 RepID=UPI000FD6D4F5|nr:hypothetical protein [Paenibacillus ehimensis]MEC0211279.1 hypothetical protein [Paenibacillus ehimensis]
MLSFNLSQNELEELDTIKELCEDMYVDGNKVICFEILSELINEKTTLKDISTNDLLIVYEQLKGYKLFWNDIEWFDNEIFENMLPKINHIIKEELSSRKK